MKDSVILTQIKKTKSNGISYSYWVLRWFATNGKWCSKSLGPVNKLSKRQAEKLRSQKQTELQSSPGRRNVTGMPTIKDYLEQYYANRQSELAGGTLELHMQTGRYLKGFLGENTRLGNIQRADARAFKAALANGDLMFVNTKKHKLVEATVNMHIRNARKIFGIAVDDDVLLFNPFDKVAGTPPVPKAWHEVTDDEFHMLMTCARAEWQLLLGLTRYAALRRSEALNLQWDQIDWDRSRLTVIANEEWRPKDRDSRVVPIVPELYKLLLQSFEKATPGVSNIISPDTIVAKNISRDFSVLCKKADVARYSKPLHTLRKTCLTRWSREYPQHVVAAWAGHASTETTSQFYLQVSEAEYLKAAGKTKKVARLIARPAISVPKRKNGANSQVNAVKPLT
jgi:integrase